jgi:hypothetical protein
MVRKSKMTNVDARSGHEQVCLPFGTMARTTIESVPQHGAGILDGMAASPCGVQLQQVEMNCK